MDAGPRPGDTLGRYRLTRWIGAGGMGVVFLARDERLDREVALKILPPGVLSDADARRRLQSEARALSRLNHPNIATIHDLDRHGEVDLLVMEWIPGHTLSDAIEQGPLTEREVVDFGRQLTAGLIAAHAAGVIHRDVKPGNLRVTSDGRLKILDFGVARTLQPAADLRSTQTATTLEVGGTIPYMAPEQIRGEPGDERSDVYSAGAVLYELATGRRPFADRSGVPLLEAILTEDPSRPSTRAPKLSRGLEGVILKALEKLPGRRYQSAGEMGAALDALGHERQPERKRARSPLLLGAALLFAAAALAAWLVAGRTVPPAPRPQVRSIAVLPLDNLSRDTAEEYFADGMTEALIADLAKIRALRVISRTSVMRFKKTTLSLPDVARALKVDAVVEGSVLRDGDRIRIVAQLIDGATDQHLWAQTYEGDARNVLQLQAEVAQAIAREINVTLTPDDQQRLAPPATVNPAAHRTYLEGRYEWNKRTPEALKQAIVLFQRSIALEPDYAPAHAGLAAAYVVLPGPGIGAMPTREAEPLARAAAQRALALDPLNFEAYLSLAYVELFAWHWDAAQRAFERANEINPHHGSFWYATYLAARRRTREAVVEAARARDVDPLSPIASAGVSWMHHLAGEHAQAIVEAQRALELDPAFPMGLFRLGWGLALAGRHADARRAFERVAAPGLRLESEAGIAYVEGLAGRRREAARVISALEARRRAGGYVSAANMALAWTALGDRDRAFAWLDVAVEEQAWGLAHLAVDPAFDPLRSDPRFAAVLKRIGL
jgi:TolB-like protein